MVGVISSEWGPTRIFPVSAPLAELSATSVALHLPVLFSDPLPPFLEFFNTVLAHYQIHVLHLDLRSTLPLSSFTFRCEKFLSIPPSVALLPHFFSLHMTTPDHRSGCASLQADDATTGECIDMEIDHFGEGFTRQWVVVDAGRYNPLLLTRPFEQHRAPGGSTRNSMTCGCRWCVGDWIP
ncbi:hypothetical protein D1007_10326 [Hordeum vulgare]|nr:hypothetical protein D1007_10326 [Hordeum vulgare]